MVVGEIGMNEHPRRIDGLDYNGRRLMDGLEENKCARSSSRYVPDGNDCTFSLFDGKTFSCFILHMSVYPSE